MSGNHRDMTSKPESVYNVLINLTFYSTILTQQAGKQMSASITYEMLNVTNFRLSIRTGEECLT